MKQPTAKQRRLRRKIKRSFERAAKVPSQRVVLVIHDTEGGQGRPEFDLEFEPGLAQRTTNSNAINVGLRLKTIIQLHWRELIKPAVAPAAPSPLILPR